MNNPYLTEGIPGLVNGVRNRPASLPLIISKFYVKSDIRFRFATTVMSTTMFNTNPHSSTEATFNAELPEKGYISYFTMTIGDRVIVGEVKEKKKAQHKYDRASARGQTAALVSEVPRETNRFDITVNVAASSNVSFNLTYVEMLERKLSCYRHVLNIKPSQIVENYIIHVSIHESRTIKGVKVPQISHDVTKEHLTLEKISQSQGNVGITYDVSGKSCDITYTPTIQQQKEFHGDLGVNGQFSVFYDVCREDDAGDLLVSNGYFLHFFAPDPDRAGVKTLPQHVVFILDTSGSMIGRKLVQLKDAMKKILAELNDEDCFNIIEFNNTITMWRDNLQSIGNREEGNAFVNSLTADGGTNIDWALSDGLSMLKQKEGKSEISTIFFLTDGAPTTGETNRNRILENVRRQNEQITAKIYSLAFGDDADLHFLKRLSSEHGGVCRKIYMDSDANQQVSGFYQEISSPLLSHVNITYMEGYKIIASKFLCQLKLEQALTGESLYYSGDEYTVCGKIKRGGTVTGRVSGRKVGSGEVNMKVEGTYMEDEGGDIGRMIEKVWVCLTIKKILAEMDKTNIRKDKENLRKRALELSLKYGLVTALTSMVVTEENADEREIEKYKERTGKKARGCLGPGRKPGGCLTGLFGCFRRQAGKTRRSEPRPKTICFESRGLNAEPKEEDYSQMGDRSEMLAMRVLQNCSEIRDRSMCTYSMTEDEYEYLWLSSAEDLSAQMILTRDVVQPHASSTTTLYNGSKDSPDSDVCVRAAVKDSIMVEIVIEYSTYTINITPHKIQVTNNQTGHTQSHSWGENEVVVGGLMIMIHTDMLEVEVEGEKRLKFKITTEKDVKGVYSLYFSDVTKPNM